MKVTKAKVENRVLEIQEYNEYAGEGNVDKIVFEFDSEWEKLDLRTCIFMVEGKNYFSQIIDNECIIPSEAYITGNIYLGVYGTNSEHSSVLDSKLATIYIEGKNLSQLAIENLPNPNTWELYILEIEGLKSEVEQYLELTRENAENAELSANNAQNSAAEAFESENNAGVYADLAVSNANASSVNKDATDRNVSITEENKQATEQLKEEANSIKEETARLKQDVIELMSTDTKSYFFNTIAERDAFVGIRYCDRCSVLETRADYIYTNEWVKTSDWDALKTVAWEIITGKPNFSTVATSGSYNDLSDKPNRYESFVTITDGIWDFSVSDKIILQDTNLVSISNVYNGAVGTIISTLELDLPANSRKAVDYDYIQAETSEHYMYTFIFDGNNFHFTRTVCV